MSASVEEAIPFICLLASAQSGHCGHCGDASRTAIGQSLSAVGVRIQLRSDRSVAEFESAQWQTPLEFRSTPLDCTHD